MNEIPAVRRHALGLPAGSVRAAHVLAIVGLVCALIVIPSREVMVIPPYLIYLLFIIIGHYFASHGVTIASVGSEHAKPLYLPGGFVRFLVIIALSLAVASQIVLDSPRLEAQYDRSLEMLRRQPLMPVLILGGFFVGTILRAVVGRANPPHWLQDFEAWVSLLALVGLLAASVIHLIINPSLEQPRDLPAWEGILGAIIAFYFGERS